MPINDAVPFLCKQCDAKYRERTMASKRHWKSLDKGKDGRNLTKSVLALCMIPLAAFLHLKIRVL